jgi:hypothetical protein
MRKSKYTAEQIAYCLTQSQAGVPIAELCRKYWISVTVRRNTFRARERMTGREPTGLSERERRRALPARAAA